MDVIKAIHRRRTIRAYRPEPVARDLLRQALWAAVQAPTPPISGNAPWTLCVIEAPSATTHRWPAMRRRWSMSTATSERLVQ